MAKEDEGGLGRLPLEDQTLGLRESDDPTDTSRKVTKNPHAVNPGAVTVTRNEDNTGVNLTWNLPNPPGNLEEFEIQAQGHSGGTTSITTESTNQNYYFAFSGTAPVTAKYRVRALYAGYGPSAWSSWVTLAAFVDEPEEPVEEDTIFQHWANPYKEASHQSNVRINVTNTTPTSFTLGYEILEDTEATVVSGNYSFIMTDDLVSGSSSYPENIVGNYDINFEEGANPLTVVNIDEAPANESTWGQYIVVTVGLYMSDDSYLGSRPQWFDRVTGERVFPSYPPSVILRGDSVPQFRYYLIDYSNLLTYVENYMGHNPYDLEYTVSVNTTEVFSTIGQSSGGGSDNINPYAAITEEDLAEFDENDVVKIIVRSFDQNNDLVARGSTPEITLEAAPAPIPAPQNVTVTPNGIGRFLLEWTEPDITDAEVQDYRLELIDDNNPDRSEYLEDVYFTYEPGVTQYQFDSNEGNYRRTERGVTYDLRLQYRNNYDMISDPGTTAGNALPTYTSNMITVSDTDITALSVTNPTPFTIQGAGLDNVEEVYVGGQGGEHVLADFTVNQDGTEITGTIPALSAPFEAGWQIGVYAYYTTPDDQEYVDFPSNNFEAYEQSAFARQYYVVVARDEDIASGSTTYFDVVE